MTKPRVPETNEGIQDALDVAVFDRFAQGMRDKGWNNVETIIAAGVCAGDVLEIGPGPGYVGLEWLKACPEGRLTALEISPEMIAMATKNAAGYGFSSRVQYAEGNALEMPFADDSFDAVFSNGSLHEWEDPRACIWPDCARAQTRRKILRCRHAAGCQSASGAHDLRPSTKPKEIRPGFWTSCARPIPSRSWRRYWRTSD